MTMSRFRIAAITTCFHPRAHADVILSRWFVPRETDRAWGWNGPRSAIASLHTHQCPDNDVSRAFCREHGVPIHDTVADALCAGGSTLAVDGVMLICEHGKYNHSPFGSLLYPRKELFDQIVEVFRSSGRAVPVFCDKHYSWNFDWATEMVDTAREMGFFLFGGSSIPLCPRRPAINFSDAMHPINAVAIFFDQREAYGYHSLEFVQSVIEQRPGGESGVASIRTWTREQLDAHLDEDRRRLLRAAIAAAPTTKPGDYRDACQPPLPEAFEVTHRDGARMLHVNLHGHVANWSIAMLAGDGESILSTSALHGGADEHFPHFAALSRMIEDGLTGQTLPHDPRRNLLTTGATAAMMRAFAQPGVELQTPELQIAYE